MSTIEKGKNEYRSEQDVAELLIRAHDGDCALLYIWQKVRKRMDPEAAARDLCFTLSQVQVATEKLQRMGLIITEETSVTFFPGSVPVSPDHEAENVIVAEKDPTEDVFPDYGSEDISKFSAEDSAFRALTNRLEIVLGTVPTRQDLCKLLVVYHRLKIPADVLFVLFNYCTEIIKNNPNSEAKPTMNFIERQAYIWANRGITCVENAEDYAEQQKKLKSLKGRIKKIMEINDRNLTSNEDSVIESWLTAGFEEEAIRIAYERTVEKTGKRSLPYMDKILLRWNESGIHTVSEIQQKDPLTGKRRKKEDASTSSGFDPGAIDNITIIKG